MIFDRNGVLLAENRPSFSLSLVKERVSVNVEDTVERLQSLLVIDDRSIQRFYKKLKSRGRRPYDAVQLKLGLSEQEIATIAENQYRFPGVEVTVNLSRHYPMADLYAHSVGYVASINDREEKNLKELNKWENYIGTNHIGKTGIEKVYEKELHGEVGYRHVEKDASGRVLRVLDSTPPIRGSDVVLHLDTGLQKVAFDALEGERGSIVAIDVKNGGVLATVSMPSFDPNLFAERISYKDYNALRDSKDVPLLNRAVQGQYPPGSTIKPMFGIIGLELDAITERTRISDPGFYRLENSEHKYRDWKKGGHGSQVDLHQAIVESCDTFFYELGFSLGIERLHNFGVRFGLGEKTGIDQTSERPGLFPSKQWKKDKYNRSWYAGETINASIGQGYMLATPTQLAVATAVVATRGKRFQPQLMKSINGEEFLPTELESVLLTNEADWDYVTRAMKDVVHGPRGTAKKMGQGLAYTMAGKTGTAQVISIAQDEEYDAEAIAKRNRDHALFIAFAPVEDPLIAVAVIVENGEHGSSTAAPMARKVIDHYMAGLLSEVL